MALSPISNLISPGATRCVAPKELINLTDKFHHYLVTKSAIININCILRTLEITQKNLVGDYEVLFSGIPTVGLSSYGEQYIGHINQTATMLVFK